MSFNIEEQFDNYEVTNGQFRKKTSGSLGTAAKLGCTGELSVEAEIKTVTKKCEGKTAKEVTMIQKLNGTFKGHMPVGVLRDVFGLTNQELKTGVYGYSTKSIGASGNLTFDVYDLGRENHKYIAFPNITFTGGLNFTLTNGSEEIAEVDVPFSAFADENNYFFYEGFESDITESSVKTGWNKTFDSQLVKADEL